MLRTILVAITIMCSVASAAVANCATIDQLDKLHILQVRLASNPDTGLFEMDIRQLRAISGALSERDMLEAVDGNTLVGKGAEIVSFLRQTQSLLQRASLDDPLSVQPHFTRPHRQTLANVGRYLRDLRCTQEQIEMAQSQSAEAPIRNNSDAEDLQEVADTIRQAADDLLEPRNALLALGVIALAMIVTPVIKNRLRLRRRRAKRHNANHPTQYDYDGARKNGALIDINCYGTKLRHDGETPLSINAGIAIEVEGQSTPGTIVWSNRHYSGVQFKQIITLEQVDYIRATQ